MQKPDRTAPAAEVDLLGYCTACGEYAPKSLDGSRRIHECDATPPLDGMPPIVTVCPTCGRAGRYRWGCWGTTEHPHEHTFMVTTRELVSRVAAA